MPARHPSWRDFGDEHHDFSARNSVEILLLQDRTLDRRLLCQQMLACEETQSDSNREREKTDDGESLHRRPLLPFTASIDL
jgi:hypothetical protein